MVVTLRLRLDKPEPAAVTARSDSLYVCFAVRPETVNEVMEAPLRFTHVAPALSEYWYPVTGVFPVDVGAVNFTTNECNDGVTDVMAGAAAGEYYWAETGALRTVLLISDEPYTNTFTGFEPSTPVIVHDMEDVVVHDHSPPTRDANAL